MTTTGISNLVIQKKAEFYTTGLEPGTLYVGEKEYHELLALLQQVLFFLPFTEDTDIKSYMGMQVICVDKETYLEIGASTCKYCGVYLTHRTKGKYPRYCDVCEVMAE